MYTPEQKAAAVVEHLEQIFAMVGISTTKELNAIYEALQVRFQDRPNFFGFAESLVESCENTRYFPNIPALPNDQFAAVEMMNLLGVLNRARMAKAPARKAFAKLAKDDGDEAITAFVSNL